MRARIAGRRSDAPASGGSGRDQLVVGGVDDSFDDDLSGLLSMVHLHDRTLSGRLRRLVERLAP